MKFRVLVREVHVSHRIVEADSLEDLNKDLGEAANADEVYCEYSHTLPKDTWTVEEEK